MSILRRLLVWWKLKEFARKDSERYGSREQRSCNNCGKRVDPLTSWINFGQLVCSSACWMALRYPGATELEKPLHHVRAAPGVKLVLLDNGDVSAEPEGSEPKPETM